MSGDDTASAVYLLLAVVLVGSALFSRRLPLGQTFRMLAAWAAIFTVGTVLFGFRHDIGDILGNRILDRAEVSGGTVRIPMAEDGHFWVEARINGQPIRLMVDSGASVTTLSRATAADAGVEAEGMFPVMVGTANGVIEVRRARVRSIVVGDIAMEELAVHLAPNTDLDVIGMNFLSKLSRWSVEGRTLILTP